jgi:phosphoribosyl 1,2-cyclic phosphodiesterase
MEDGMSIRLSVLASGSSGNATLLEFGGYGLLVDAGLGPQELSGRLTSIEVDWSHIDAVLLTHTHTDHWKRRTLSHLARNGIPLYCHVEHHRLLGNVSAGFKRLLQAGLVRNYRAFERLSLAQGLSCVPLPVCHDSLQTFAFRMEMTRPGCPAVAVGYATDLGSWTAELARALANVDVLAIEFNHDVEMQYLSGRSPYLIERVLGDRGHLSNKQAASLLREVLLQSEPGRLRHVIQLHLSRDCNRVGLAVEAARIVLEDHGPDIDLHTSAQDVVGPCVALDGNGALAALRFSRPRELGLFD